MLGNNLDDSLKELTDGELSLRLVLGIETTKQFYYNIYRLSDETKVGQCGIRLTKNDDNYYLGNIEYEIFSIFRGNHYAEKASRLLAKVAKYYEISELSITANPKNTASIKTIENLGASFVVVKDVPKKMRLYRSGTKKVAIFNWDIMEKGERKL